MIKNYFTNTAGDQTSNEDKREIAVAAALEIAKSSVGADSQHPRSDRVEGSLRGVEQQISSLADAIQAALEKK